MAAGVVGVFLSLLVHYEMPFFKGVVSVIWRCSLMFENSEQWAHQNLSSP